MEIIQISKTKIKVMLSSDDMKAFDFDPSFSGDISNREAFRNILKAAKDKCGFDTEGDRIFVQYYPEKGGGCEIFVTRLSADILKSNQKTVNDRKYIIYRFKVLQNLLMLCRTLTDEITADVYVVENALSKKEYYMLTDRKIINVGEFSGEEIHSEYYYFLREHGRKLICDPISILGRLC